VEAAAVKVEQAGATAAMLVAVAAEQEQEVMGGQEVMGVMEATEFI